MSTTILEVEGIDVGRYAGPARADGGDRRRFQITNVLTSEWVTLSLEQMIALKLALAGSNLLRPSD